MSPLSSSVTLPLLAVCFCLAVVGNVTALQGDTCEGPPMEGVTWLCRHYRSCPSRRIAYQERNEPMTFCDRRKGIVCCDVPSPTVPTPKTTPKPPRAAETAAKKATRKCEEYGKSVMVEMEDPITGEKIMHKELCMAEPHIYGGQDSQPKEYPHQALIGYGDGPDTKWVCGGSLISDNFVLTAAHCKTFGPRGDAKWVRLGDYDMASVEDERNMNAGTKVYEIIEIIPHPSYRPPDQYHDLALLKLNQTVAFNAFIRPICLETESQFPNEYAIATGWGLTETSSAQARVLQKANLTITETKACQDHYKSVTNMFSEGIRSSTQMCAGGATRRTATCKGDSGGPLQVRKVVPECMYSLLGVTSAGYGCDGSRPAVFSKVSAYLGWIVKVVWPDN